MQHRNARRGLSLFLAIVLVLTCNSATFQPLSALAAGGSAPEGAPLVQDGQEDESFVTTASDSGSGGPIDASSADGAIDEDVLVEGGAGGGDVGVADDALDKEPSRQQEPRDLTDGGDAIVAAFTGIFYVDADGKAFAEVQDGCVDVSGVDASAASDWELALRTTVDPSKVRSGDFILMEAPPAPLSLTSEEALQKANAEHASLVVCSVADGMVRLEATEEAADAAAPFDLEVRVPVALAAEALDDAPAPMTLALPGKATATVVLPAKATASVPTAEAPDVLGTLPPALLAVAPGLSALAVAPAAAGDVTNERDQLKLDLATFLYVDAAGKEHEIKPTGTTYDFSNVPLSTISEMRMEVDFSILKDDGNRTIKEGEQFHYQLPTQLFKAENVDTEQVIASPAGDTIAVYTIEDNVVTVTFKQAVNLDEGNVDIVGGVDCTFQLNHDGLSDDEPTSAEMTLQEGGTTYTFTAPKRTSDLAGIEKTGAYNKDDGTVTWTITVGSDPKSAGVPLRGITVTDAYDKKKQTGAKVTDAEGNELAVEETDQGFTYTFPEGSTAAAPYKLTVTAQVDNSVLEQAVNGDQTLSNEASMSSPSSSTVKVTGEPSATGTTEVKRYGLTKLGTPLSSDTIAWDITVNQGGAGAAKDVVVYDRLDSRAKYKAGTLKVNGAAIANVYTSAPSPAPTGTYAIVTDEPGGTQLLEVHFDGTVSDERRIAFETSVTAPDQKDEAINFPNSAWITYTWPNGYGVGPGTFTPIGIDTDFQVAYVNKETPSYDASTGEITWTIKPSTRTDNYTGGVITDAVPADQRFIEGSVKVKNKGVELTSKEMQANNVFVNDGNNLTFTLLHPPYALNDIEIEYRTQALNFQRENMTTHLYENTAHLDVYVDGAPKFADEDTASRSFMNRFLAKNSSYQVVDDGSGSTGYLHYQIVVNDSHMPCANLHVTDNLTALATEVIEDGSGTSLGTIDASEWSIATGDKAIKVTEIERGKAPENGTDVTSSYATSDWTASRVIDATFTNGASTTNSYRIDLYLTLDKDTLLELHKQHPAPFSISATNKAQASSDGFNDDTSVEVDCVGKTDGGEIDNQLVSKSVDGSRQGEGLLQYRININPNGTNLQGATLTDVPDPSLSIDLSSVKLYKAKHGPNGAISPVVGDEVDASAWEKKLVHHADADCTALQVKLPDGTASYVLLYDARVVSAVKSGSASNKATLVVGGDELGSDVCTAEVDASSWGWLTKKAIYKLVKADEFGGKASPIAGVTFNLYSDPGKKTLVATAVSNKQGLVAFYGLEKDTTYYYDEPEASSGYKALEYNADTNKFITGAVGSSTVAGTATLNKRTTSTVPVEIKKTFDDATNHVTNPQSSFKLYLYPNGFDNAKKVPVDVTGSDGEYAYAGSDVAAELANKSDDGTLKISGLPWGDYGLEETNPCGGYAAYEGMRYFSVKAPADASGTWTVDYAPTGTDQDVGAGTDGKGALVNHKTRLTVQKTTESGNDLRGAVLSVYQSNGDGTKGSEKATSPFFSGGLTTTITGASPVTTFDWDLAGIPAGTYWLCEDTAPSDPDVGRFEDVKFEVDKYGKLSVLSGGGTAEGTTLTVADESNQVSVKKVDQWGKGVAGATLQLQERSGSGSTYSWSNVSGASWTTTADDAASGHAFGGLERNKTYRIVETTVPGGYMTASHEAQQMVEFTIDEYGKVKDDVDLHNGSAPADGALGIFQNACSGNDFTLRNERIVGHAQFAKQKTDLDGANPAAVAKVRFDLYRIGADGVGVKVNETSHFTSGADGRVTTVGATLQNALTGEAISRGLAPGTYYFQEVVAPDVVNSGQEADYRATFEVKADGTNRYTWGGTGDPTVIDAEVAHGGGTPDSTLVNASLNAQVKLKKVDADDAAKPVIGATYELRDYESASATAKYTVVDRQKTSAKGTTFTNTVKAADSLGNTPTATATVDGELFFVNVPAFADGHVYKVVETAPAPGYKKDTAVYEVEAIDAAVANKVYHLKDAAGSTVSDKQNSFTLAKSVEAGDSNASRFTIKPAGSAKFADGSTEARTLDLASGPAELPGLLVAKALYTISETVPPAGYQTVANFQIIMGEDGSLTFYGNHPAVEITSSEGNHVITVTDSATKVSLGKKAVGSETLLAGARFQIAGTLADGTQQLTVETEASPVEVSKKLVAEREYRIAETTPAPGCIASPWTDTYRTAQLDDGKLVVKLTARGQLQYKTTSNSWMNLAGNQLIMRDAKNAFTLKKTDAAGNALTGATFQLTGTFADGSSTKTLVGDGASEETLTGQLVAGETYRVSETTPPEGCAAVAEFDVTMGADGTVTSNNAPDGVSIAGHAVTVADKPSSVSIAKKDADGATFVAGAAFQLTGRFAHAVTESSIEFTSAGAAPDGLDNGLFEGKLVAGETYTLVETAPPAGYAISLAPTNLKIDAAGSLFAKAAADPGDAWKPVDGACFTVIDQVNALTIDKAGEAGASVAGTEFKLTGDFAQAKGDIVWTVGADGASHKVEGELRAWIDADFAQHFSYTLTETSPAPGYTVAAPVTLRVLPDGTLQQQGGDGAWASVAGNELTVRNTLNRVSFVKANEDGSQLLAGAVFELKPASGAFPDGDAAKSFTTTGGKPTGAADGAFDGVLKAHVEGDASTEYVLTETAPPAGYEITMQPQTFMIDDDGALHVKGGGGWAAVPGNRFVAVDGQNALTVGKTDAQAPGTGLAKAAFALAPLGGGAFADGATQPLTWTSTNAPELLTGTLTAGVEYALAETKPAPGYVVSSWTESYADAALADDGSLVIRLTAGGALQYRSGADAWTDVAGNELVMKDARNAFTLRKADASGNALEGATFQMTGAFADGSSTKTLLGAGASEETLTGALTAGTEYALVETAPAPGSVVSPWTDTAAFADAALDASGALVVRLTDSGQLQYRAAGADGAAWNDVEGNALVMRDAATSLTLRKQVEGGGEAAATFTIKGVFADGADEAVKTLVNDASEGTLEGSLVAGAVYTVSETVPPAGYRTVQDFSIVLAPDGTVKAAPGTTLPVGVEITGGSVVTVTDSGDRMLIGKAVAGSDELLAGARFRITGEFVDGTEPVEVTTGAALASVSKKLVAEREYRIAETAPAPGCVVSPWTDTFGDARLDGGSLVVRLTDLGQLQYRNGADAWTDVAGNKLVMKDARNAFELRKADASGNALEGATFRMTGAFADDETEKALLSGASEDALDGLLVAGETYAIAETGIPQGCVRIGDFSVTVDERGVVSAVGELPAGVSIEGHAVKVANERNRFTFGKIDADGAPLKGATFKLTGTFAGSVDEESRTLLAGDFQEELEGQLVAGNDYVLTESAAPDGYVVFAGSATLTCGADGTLAFKGEAPDGVALDGAGRVVTVANAPIGFSFTKLERYVESCSDPDLGADDPAAERPLAGAEFTAFEDEACTQVARTGDGRDMKASSDADGKVSFSLVKVGTHYVKETAVPAGHVPNETVYNLDVSPDGTVGLFAPLGEDGVLDKVVNDVLRADIRIKKVSETDEGKTLPNSTYGLYRRASAQPPSLFSLFSAAAAFAVQLLGGPDDSSAASDEGLQLVAKATTGADGYLAFEGVLVGQEYVIRELEAPDGSLVSKNPITITFEADEGGAPRVSSFDDGSGTAEVDENGHIVWKEPQVIVEFDKKGPDGELLAGATLQVVDERGVAVGEPWVSQGDAGHRVEGVLVAGETYRLQELDAPDGYLVAEDETFAVEALERGPQEGYVQRVEMVDELEPTGPAALPGKPPASMGPFGFLAKTGDVPLGPLAGGMALTALGVAAAVGVRRRRKRS